MTNRSSALYFMEMSEFGLVVDRDLRDPKPLIQTGPSDTVVFTVVCQLRKWHKGLDLGPGLGYSIRVKERETS